MSAPPSVQTPRPRRTNVSIGVVLAAVLAGLVFLATASVIAINFTIGRTNTLELLRDRGELATNAIEGQVRSQLDPATEQLDYLANILSDDAWSDAEQRVADLLTGALAATPQITRLLYADSQLHVTLVERDGDRAKTSLSDQSTNLALRRSLAQAAGHPGGWWGDLILDPRGGGFALLNRRHSVWRGGEMAGELVALVSVRELSALLPPVTTGPATGRTFILYDREQVLAHRRLLQPIAGLTAQHPLPGLTEIDDPVLAAIWDPQANVPFAGNGSGFHIVDVEGVRHLYLYHVLTGYGPKPMIVGAWFLAADVFGELRRLGFATGVGVVILILACLMAIRIGRRIARPISQMAVAANQLRTLDFTRMPELPESRLREFADQARAFNDVLAGLRWLEAYVPRALVRHLVRAGSGRKFPSVEREMTVLFTDVVGFTTLSERRSAADTAAFLNQHFAMVTQAIEAEDGIVDKFIGDGVMAFWNAPHRHRDHARRAARAALAIAAALEADNQVRAAAGKPPVRLRIGIHSGPVVVGNIGPAKRVNYTIVGDTVNTAQRIEQLGRDLSDGDRATTILVSASTAAALGADFECRAVGEFSVRGRDELVPVYRLTAMRPAASRPAARAVRAAG